MVAHGYRAHGHSQTGLKQTSSAKAFRYFGGDFRATPWARSRHRLHEFGPGKTSGNFLSVEEFISS
jgi:hypothetical protein